MFIDSHCHLSYEPLIKDIDRVLSVCEKHKVEKLLTIGTDYKSSKICSDLSMKYKNIYSTVGIHPTEDESKFDEIEKLTFLISNNNKIIGVGETGLDYFRVHSKISQKKNFYKQIEIANQYNLPVIVHSRDAENDTIQVIKDYSKTSKTKFLIHCFTGSPSFAEKLIELNAYISFSGVITFKKTEYLSDVIKNIPNDKILIETDSPFLSPEPYRGKKNYPYNLSIIAEKIAKIKNMEINDIGLITSKNFNNLFFNKK